MSSVPISSSIPTYPSPASLSSTSPSSTSPTPHSSSVSLSSPKLHPALSSEPPHVKPIKQDQLNRKLSKRNKASGPKLFNPGGNPASRAKIDAPNLNITRQAELVNEVSVRMISLIERVVTGHCYSTKQIKEMMNQLHPVIHLPLESYIKDLIEHLVTELTLGGLLVRQSNGSIVALQPEHRPKIERWLKTKLQAFHEPYRIV